MFFKRIFGSACLAAASIAALALPVKGTAHLVSAKTSSTTSAAPHYALIDVGTFGGPDAGLDLPGRPITSQRAVIGTADTTTRDADSSTNSLLGVADPFVSHAFSWQDGHLTDLGALPGNNSSAVFDINSSGIGAGWSETGAIDPVLSYPASHAVRFEHGAVQDLGTLPGGTESFAFAINDNGQIAGIGNNGVPDQFLGPAFFKWSTQVRSFIWQNGALHDLGTLGGPDTVMAWLNAKGQVAGDSYTNDTPNAATGVPTMHPFLWQNGQMHDLGSLGGTASATFWLNDNGEVVGQGNLVGDHTYHPFLWDGTQLRDLGTLGGAYGSAGHINDEGDVTGWATTPGDTIAHTFLWKNGTMTDLAGAGNSLCTYPEWLNNDDLAVGGSCTSGVSEALLWTGGRQYDLSKLVSPTDVQLTEALFISNSGEIIARGDLANGHHHVFLLMPLGPNACGVPKLKGKSLTAAKRSITSHDCAVGTIRRASSRRIKRGRVISQKPKAGSWLKHGSRIALVVSKGS